MAHKIGTKLKQFCSKGHDTFVVGRDKSKRCSQCVKEKYIPHPLSPKLICINGHDLSILGRDNRGKGSCIQCRRDRESSDIAHEKQKEYRQENEEKIKAYMQMYYEEHRDIFIIRQLQRYDENKQKLLDYQNGRYKLQRQDLIEYQKQYSKDHPDIVALNALKSHIKRRKRIVPWDQEGIRKFYLNKPEGMEVDHIIPLCGRKISGLHILSNLQYLTREENNFKRNSWDVTLENNGWRDKISKGVIKWI